MSELFTTEALTAFLQVVLIDLVLAGDNAVVIGLAAAGLPKAQRARAILIGILAATVLRIAFAGVATQLLQIVGLLLAGGILLLWVCWKMWREIRSGAMGEVPEIESEDDTAASAPEGPPTKTFASATWQIIVADVSMSLDNVLAVAGAARDHFWVLVVGLGLSIALMGLAASLIAKLLHKHHWIAYLGLAVILYVAVDMIYRGWIEVSPLVLAALAA